MNNQLETELAVAWEEVSFWQDFVTWSITENDTSPEPRIMEALENAWRRYEKSLHLQSSAFKFGDVMKACDSEKL